MDSSGIGSDLLHGSDGVEHVAWRLVHLGQGSAVTLVDADGDDDSRLPGSFANGIRGGRRHRHFLVEQLPLLRPGNIL